ncbi:MAG TPA: response regulator [Thermoanaerobaculia bacterium]|nr:response regulator [Thermoanaerobaculia bacterium]
MSRSDAPVSSDTVLVVDDDQALRGFFTTLLSRKGFNVDVASDGRTAYDQLNRHNYSVILLDLMMPNVNGFELLERIRRDSPALLDRVIIMTGASQRAIENLDTTRVWGMIRKPFDIDQLVNSTIDCAQRRKRGNA